MQTQANTLFYKLYQNLFFEEDFIFTKLRNLSSLESLVGKISRSVLMQRNAVVKNKSQYNPQLLGPTSFLSALIKLKLANLQKLPRGRGQSFWPSLHYPGLFCSPCQLFYYIFWTLNFDPNAIYHSLATHQRDFTFGAC